MLQHLRCDTEKLNKQAMQESESSSVCDNNITAEIFASKLLESQLTGFSFNNAGITEHKPNLAQLQDLIHNPGSETYYRK